MTKYRLCRYEGKQGKGYSAQHKDIFTLGIWCNVRNIYGDIIVRENKDDMQDLINQWRRMEKPNKITPIKETTNDK